MLRLILTDARTMTSVSCPLADAPAYLARLADRNRDQLDLILMLRVEDDRGAMCSAHLEDLVLHLLLQGVIRVEDDTLQTRVNGGRTVRLVELVLRGGEPPSAVYYARRPATFPEP